MIILLFFILSFNCLQGMQDPKENNGLKDKKDYSFFKNFCLKAIEDWVKYDSYFKIFCLKATEDWNLERLRNIQKMLAYKYPEHYFFFNGASYFKTEKDIKLSNDTIHAVADFLDEYKDSLLSSYKDRPGRPNGFLSFEFCKDKSNPPVLLEGLGTEERLNSVEEVIKFITQNNEYEIPKNNIDTLENLILTSLASAFPLDESNEYLVKLERFKKNDKESLKLGDNNSLHFFHMKIASDVVYHRNGNNGQEGIKKIIFPEDYKTKLVEFGVKKEYDDNKVIVCKEVELSLIKNQCTEIMSNDFLKLFSVIEEQQ